MIARKPILAIIIFFITISLVQADSSIFTHNLNLGMKRKDAKKSLENAGYEVQDETRVSKKMRTFWVEGFFYNDIAKAAEQKISTKFEFYNDKMMNSTLHLQSKDYNSHVGFTNRYSAELIEIYGKPNAFEKVMSIKSWMWRAGSNKILLNSDSRKKTIKISYIYLPAYAEKYEDQVKLKLKGEPLDPATEMFLK